MIKLSISQYKSSGLNSTFDSAISSIEIEDTPFNNGAFGEVYHAEIKGIKQVIKIFKNDSPQAQQSAQKCYDNIIHLQNSIICKNKELKQSQKTPIEKITALHALPLFSFCCSMNGNTRYGYSTYFLDDKWICFDYLLEGAPTKEMGIKLRKWFYTEIGSAQRLNFVKELLEAFIVFEDIHFVYADLNPKNFFINTETGNLCLIDYDSGGIDCEPDTFGKAGDWLAPELQYEKRFTSNRFTDYWSIAITIHYFFFPFHPLFYLKAQSEKRIKEYFQKYKYPQIKPNDSLFNKPYKTLYKEYTRKLYDESQVPAKIREALVICFNDGYFNAGSRPTSKQWFSRINSSAQTYIAPQKKIPSVGQNKKRNNEFYHRNKILISICVCVLIFFSISFLIYQNIRFKEIPITNTQIYTSKIPGKYTVHQIINGTKGGLMVAEIKEISEKNYKLILVSDYDPVIYDFYLENENIISPQLGNGVFKYNDNLDKTTLTFEKENIIWEFVK